MVLEFRQDPTKKTEIIFSTERAKRPNIFGAQDKTACPFCKGSEANTPPTTCAKPHVTEWKVRCFRNAFPLLSPTRPFEGMVGPAFGDHEVIVETDEHGSLFQDFSEGQLALVMEAYKNRYKAISTREGIACVYLFKNHGKGGGASIEHEHAQIVGLPFVPELLQRELDSFEAHKQEDGKCSYCAMMESQAENLLEENDSFAALCPSFGRFPAEVWIVAKRHFAAFPELTQTEEKDFMAIFASVIRKVHEKQGHDYVVAFHSAPQGKDFHFHAEVYPRTNTWAGLELGAGLIVNTKSEKQALTELKGTVEEEKA